MGGISVTRRGRTETALNVWGRYSGRQETCSAAVQQEVTAWGQPGPRAPATGRAPLSVPHLSRAQAGTREHIPGPTQGAPWSTRTDVHQVRWGRGTPACSWAGTHVAMYLASPKEPVGCCSFGVSILGGQSPKLTSWAKAEGSGAFSPSQCPKNIPWDVAAFISDEDK